jgi:hypothetical protein
MAGNSMKGTLGRHPYRLGQRLYRVQYTDDAIPYIETGKVTRVTKVSYYVNGCTERDKWWASRKLALDAAYVHFFRRGSGLLRQHQWEADTVLYAVCELRRLERRLAGRALHPRRQAEPTRGNHDQ